MTQNNRFYTVLVIPEKTSKLRRFTIPYWTFKALFISLPILGLLAAVMLLDYWYVMDQVNENKDLKLENRRLKQQVQIYKSRMDTIESTLERIQNFSTRLKVITNLEDRDGLVQRLNENLPDASTNTAWKSPEPQSNSVATQSMSTAESIAQKSNEIRELLLNPEEIEMREEQKKIEENFLVNNRKSLLLEQNLHDLYELLSDQKAFLSALPIKRPAQGLITSGFGVRRSPYGEGEKMHEGVDIANQTGTTIRAPANGTVSFAGKKPGYGRTLVLDHGYGLETWYGHTHQILTKTGDKIRRGQTIALMGNTGRSTGSHLHYEIRVRGIPVDPLTYLLEN